MIHAIRMTHNQMVIVKSLSPFLLLPGAFFLFGPCDEQSIEAISSAFTRGDLI